MDLIRFIRIYLGIGAAFALLGFVGMAYVKKINHPEDKKFIERVTDWKLIEMNIVVMLTWPMVILHLILKKFKINY